MLINHAVEVAGIRAEVPSVALFRCRHPATKVNRIVRLWDEDVEVAEVCTCKPWFSRFGSDCFRNPPTIAASGWSDFPEGDYDELTRIHSNSPFGADTELLIVSVIYARRARLQAPLHSPIVLLPICRLGSPISRFLSLTSMEPCVSVRSSLQVLELDLNLTFLCYRTGKQGCTTPCNP